MNPATLQMAILAASQALKIAMDIHRWIKEQEAAGELTPEQREAAVAAIRGEGDSELQRLMDAPPVPIPPQ